MNDEIGFLGVGQIARSVADVGAAERWYADILGLDHLYTFGDMVFFDCGGTRLMLSQSGDKPGHESFIYLRVTDINTAYKRLTENGVSFINALHMIHQYEDGAEEWMAFFNDSEGRPIAIMSLVTDDGM